MSANKPIKVIVLLGPTSSGKSSAAIKLAKEFDGEIISADSRQVYRDMDLGTGKVAGEWIAVDNNRWETEQVFFAEGVAHHLIDFVDPQEEYNISHFKKDCLRKIEEISRRGKLPIICGGTGFWISAVVDDIKLPEVKPDPELRQELNSKSADELYEMLKELDTKRASTIDRKNKVRLIRAIEIAKALGKVPEIKKQYQLKQPLAKIVDYIKLKTSQAPFHFLQIGLDHPKEILDERIKTRLSERFEAGMVEEVKKLKEKYILSWKKIQSFGLGYYWIPLFLQGLITEEEMRERVYIAERGYAKRQRTWFKRDQRIAWNNDYEIIKNLVTSFLKKNS